MTIHSASWKVGLVSVLIMTTSALCAAQAVPPPPAPAAPAAPAAPPSIHSHNDQIRFAPAATGGTAPTTSSAAFACLAGKSEHSRNWTSVNNDDMQWTASYTGNGCSVDLHVRGVITFADDLSGVVAIAPGGSFEAEERTPDARHRVEIKPGTGGLQHSYSVNGDTKPFDDAGRAWLASLLLGLERRSAFAADVRVPQLLKRGGNNAVLAEIQNLSGDYARGRYYSELFDQAQLTGPEIRRVFEQVGKDMTSDYEIGRVLITVLNKYDLADEPSRAAFLDTANHLKSDYERGRVLTALLARPNLSRDTLVAALRSASSMNADYEKGRVLTSVAGKRALDESMIDTYLEAVATIHGDYERGRVYTALLSGSQLTAKQVLRVLRAIQTMRTDYEMGRVLSVVASHYKLEGELRQAFIDTANHIHSEYERNRVLGTVVRRASM